MLRGPEGDMRAIHKFSVDGCTVKMLTSVNHGKSYWYCGYSWHFGTLAEAEAYASKRNEEEKKMKTLYENVINPSGERVSILYDGLHVYEQDSAGNVTKWNEETYDEDSNIYSYLTMAGYQFDEETNKVIWYAVQKDQTDAWDNGSEDFETAKAMVIELYNEGYKNALIAEIDADDSFCLAEHPATEYID